MAIDSTLKAHDKQPLVLLGKLQDTLEDSRCQDVLNSVGLVSKKLVDDFSGNKKPLVLSSLTSSPATQPTLVVTDSRYNACYQAPVLPNSLKPHRNNSFQQADSAVVGSDQRSFNKSGYINTKAQVDQKTNNKEVIFASTIQTDSRPTSTEQKKGFSVESETVFVMTNSSLLNSQKSMDTSKNIHNNSNFNFKERKTSKLMKRYPDPDMVIGVVEPHIRLSDRKRASANDSQDALDLTAKKPNKDSSPIPTKSLPAKPATTEQGRHSDVMDLSSKEMQCRPRSFDVSITGPKEPSAQVEPLNFSKSKNLSLERHSSMIDNCGRPHQSLHKALSPPRISSSSRLAVQRCMSMPATHSNADEPVGHSNHGFQTSTLPRTANTVNTPLEVMPSAVPNTLSLRQHEQLQTFTPPPAHSTSSPLHTQLAVQPLNAQVVGPGTTSHTTSSNTAAHEFCPPVMTPPSPRKPVVPQLNLHFRIGDDKSSTKHSPPPIACDTQISRPPMRRPSVPSPQHKPITQIPSVNTTEGAVDLSRQNSITSPRPLLSPQYGVQARSSSSNLYPPSKPGNASSMNTNYYIPDSLTTSTKQDKYSPGVSALTSESVSNPRIAIPSSSEQYCPTTVQSATIHHQPPMRQPMRYPPPPKIQTQQSSPHVNYPNGYHISPSPYTNKDMESAKLQNPPTPLASPNKPQLIVGADNKTYIIMEYKPEEESQIEQMRAKTNEPVPIGHNLASYPTGVYPAAYKTPMYRYPQQPYYHRPQTSESASTESMMMRHPQAPATGPYHRYPPSVDPMHHQQQYPPALVPPQRSELAGHHIQHASHPSGAASAAAAMRYQMSQLGAQAMVNQRYPYPPHPPPPNQLQIPHHTDYRYKPSMPPLQPIPSNTRHLNPSHLNSNQT